MDLQPRAVKKKWHETDAGWVTLLNTPAVTLILVVALYPIVYSLWVSLHRHNLRRPQDVQFVGLGNYGQILQDSYFWDTVRISATFALVAVAGVVLLGVGFALLLNAEFRGRGPARALLIVPWAIPSVANGLMWSGILGKFGPANATLAGLHELPFIGNLVPVTQTLLTDPGLALYTVAAVHIWKEVPLATIILLAALQGIPADQYRAARMDGSTPWRTFRYITLPWLLHPLLIVMILQTMTAFRTFDLIFTLTGGGPGRATSVIAWQTYRQAFSFLDFGHANAYSYLITLMTMGIIVVYIRLLYKKGIIQT